MGCSIREGLPFGAIFFDVARRTAAVRSEYTFGSVSDGNIKRGVISATAHRSTRHACGERCRCDGCGGLSARLIVLCTWSAVAFSSNCARSASKVEASRRAGVIHPVHQSINQSESQSVSQSARQPVRDTDCMAYPTGSATGWRWNPRAPMPSEPSTLQLKTPEHDVLRLLRSRKHTAQGDKSHWPKEQ